MAGISSLSIRGIRSFGTDDRDEQKIAFEKPLTLILGQNGCGKTTIIECLRYGITGQMPPGSRNECFVHDAKINRTSEVTAQVKLKIISAKEKILSVARTMKVTALPKKTTFKTLESFLSTVDETGKCEDISSRCADLDLIINEELGVSKAIINSVIFCHQEDASWPLDEGKKVKERFDEIFDADKYNTCFDHLKKIRKEYANNIKLLDQEVRFLLEKKEEMDKKKLDIVNTGTRITEAEEKMTSLAIELKKVTDMLDAIRIVEKNLDKAKSKLEHCKTQEQDLTKSIKTIYEGTTEELQETIKNYGTQVKQKRKELDESQRNVFQFNRDEQKTADKMSSNDDKYKELMMLERQNQEKIDNRKALIIDTANLSEITVNEIESKEDVVKAINTINQKIKSLHRDLDQRKSEADTEEKKLQQLVDQSRDALARHKQKIVSKESEIKSTKKEMSKIEKDIADAKESMTRLDSIQQKLEAAEAEYETEASKLNIEESQKEINDDEKLMEQYDEEMESLNEKITKLQKLTEKVKEKDLKEEALKTKEKQFNVLINKHKSTLTDLLGKMPEKDFAVTVNKFDRQKRTEVDALKKSIKEKDLQVTSLETEIKHVRELLKGRREELTAAEDQLYKACGTQSYDATLAKLNASVEKLQDDQNTLQSSIFIITKYKKQLEENNSCPLCNRGFDTNAEVDELLSDLTTKVMDVPGKLEKCTEELQKVSAKKDDLLGLKAVNEKIKNLKENDIPQLEKRLADLDKRLNETTESLEEQQMSLMEPEHKLQTAKNLLGDMPLLDGFLREIKALTKDFEKIKAQCAGLEGEMTFDEATEKQSALRQKINALKLKIKSNQSKLNEHTKKLQSMMQKKNKLKEEYLNIQKKVQEVCTLQENLKQSESNHEKYIIELKSLQDSIGLLEVELKEKENVKSSAVNKNRNAIDEKRNYINKIENTFDKVKSMDKEIKQHEDKNVPREMERVKAVTDELMEKKMKIMKDRDELTKKIDTLKDEIAKQDVYKRDLEDNSKLRKIQEEAKKHEKEIADIEEKIKDINLDTLSEKELVMKQTKMFREKSQLEGQLSELKKRLKQIEMEVMEPRNKDIDKKYKEKYYDLKVTKALDKDIKDFAVMMDKCLMEFHKEKMENINLIIRELWSRIYRGNDIDYIEIKTEGGMSADSERRKYDYRVVQSKNGIEIDMRGRCSAGQKVLACLIIRLALAETFSTRFGILALDEPTTNLDQENIRSLCCALGEIVQERMQQKNFMFIIITHDREFIESLGNIDKVTHYYEVSRNEDGKSRIKKIRFT
ncbi:DNA repair protein RAD50 [Eumeta japonica]|uniref:DNA repair protein RAD50 n=1 Tax=Eumeta variegata TaxID=151549 RepID=A0A4C1U932_EUMVA|nr:DNA repair protein RAD50 [Eumeta japonica]